MEESNAAVFIHKVAGVYVNRGEGGRGGGGEGGGQGRGKEHEKDPSEHLLSSSSFTLADSYGK